VDENGANTTAVLPPDRRPDIRGGADDIQITQWGAAGVVELKRPQTLNALTHAMRAAMAEAFPRWARDPEIYAVLVLSSGGRAFCAGSDVREIAAWGKNRRLDARRSLAAEYALNWQLECFIKPTVSLIDGSVMGGGVGISLYGTHRVAGEGYRFAMPETGIGLFPDDGVCWTLARMPHEIGLYLALTGDSVGPADAYRLGLVTHCIPAARFGEIAAAIAAADTVDPVLDDRHVDPGPGSLEAKLPAIECCFGVGSVEEIMAALAAQTGAAQPWAQAVLDVLGRRSPLSLKITFHHMRAVRDMDLRTTLITDYRLACRLLEGHDFYEGVRAALIDRDGKPRWQPARLDEVSQAMVEALFSPLAADELNLASRAQMQSFQR
jgi:enoyl-CoA hydratase